MPIVEEILKEENLSKIKIPVLMFQAEYDSLVLPSGQNTFAEKVETCQLRYVNDSKYQIYGETDEIIVPYYSTIFLLLLQNEI